MNTINTNVQSDFPILENDLPIEDEQKLEYKENSKNKSSIVGATIVLFITQIIMWGVIGFIAVDLSIWKNYVASGCMSYFIHNVRLYFCL